ncbi:hypothetical protein IEQ34_002075 [Dendrobium chrysotoxum]|uniref:Uncharacterized protein n=1 Tax=Dendrobium chrysotoxum TaxID=161865 RepID=A0AAV7HMX3_DENCH|nr:hypothetical protein IEQ34_002075 [Dendrobium chrysotoxum]
MSKSPNLQRGSLDKCLVFDSSGSGGGGIDSCNGSAMHGCTTSRIAAPYNTDHDAPYNIHNIAAHAVDWSAELNAYFSKIAVPKHQLTKKRRLLRQSQLDARKKNEITRQSKGRGCYDSSRIIFYCLWQNRGTVVSEEGALECRRRCNSNGVCKKAWRRKLERCSEEHQTSKMWQKLSSLKLTLQLQDQLGNRLARLATQLPRRIEHEIKNY